jgi:catechol 2,3-dioxygenase-like lactoylglutathione lyase family enzyme
MKTKGMIEIILYVEDMQSQVSFYRDILELRVLYPPEISDFREEVWVTLDAGTCVVALHGGGKRRFGADAPKMVFEVDDVHVARQELVSKEVRVSEVRTAAPGVLVCDALDPEGNKFSIEMHAK